MPTQSYEPPRILHGRLWGDLNHLSPRSQAFGGGRVDAPHGVGAGRLLGRRACIVHGCGVTASFGAGGTTPSYCGQHRLPGTEDLVSSRCAVEGCGHQGVYQLIATSAVRTPGAVDSLCEDVGLGSDAERGGSPPMRRRRRRRRSAVYCSKHRCAASSHTLRAAPRVAAPIRLPTARKEESERGGCRPPGSLGIRNRLCLTLECNKTASFAFSGQRACYCWVRTTKSLIPCNMKA